MSEIKYKRCPKCGAIMKVREDTMTSSNPPMYVYDCPECKWRDFDVEKYPYTLLFQPKTKGVIVNYPPEPTEASYTVKFRNEAAKDILCALISRTSMFSGENIHHGVNVALEYADTLIRQLKEDEK